MSELDAAIGAMSATIARADQFIESLRRLVSAREADLCALQALADSRRASRELAGFESIQPQWDSRANLVAELLGSTDLARESQ